jgi:D-alanyl-D-alanine carboxypeptidase
VLLGLQEYAHVAAAVGISGLAAVRSGDEGIVVKAVVLIALATAGSLVIVIGGVALRSGSARQPPDTVVDAGSPGALVLVDDGASRREETSGFAVLRGRVPLRARDRFRVGSITKTFVAAVVLQLVGERRLALGDTVERWLPGLVPGGDRITVRQLLGHTSGLADFADDVNFVRRTVAEPQRRWTPRELVRVALAEGPVARPGEHFAYASTNYVLLGMVVEKATGASLEHQLRSRIFVPLGLRDTSFAERGAPPQERYVHGYAPSEHDGIVGSLATARDLSTVSASWAWAAGAVISNAPDLSRFLGAVLNGRLLPPRLRELMRPAPGTRYGLGLAAFRTPCGTAIGHTGALLGTVSAAWSSPDGRRRVVAMTNSFPLSPSAGHAFRRLLDSSFCGT